MWSVAEWYPVLIRGKGLVHSGDWTLYQRAEHSVELIRHDGEMAQAFVRDGNGLVEGKSGVLPLPDEVVAVLKEMLSLV